MRVVRAPALGLAAAAVVLLGCWVTGGALTDDATTAMVLTGAWFAIAAGLAIGALRRWGRAALPASAGALLTVALAGGVLLLTSRLDRVVDEDVLVAPTASGAAAATAVPSAAPKVTRTAAGTFRSGAHETRGTATLLRRPDGRLVLTLVDFSTAAGPDLRVRLVAPGAHGVEGGRDLGALKGNRGDQQYTVPVGSPTGRVVIWCRAFSVSFGTAELHPV